MGGNKPGLKWVAVGAVLLAFGIALMALSFARFGADTCSNCTPVDRGADPIVITAYAGLISALAGLISAITGLMVAFRSNRDVRKGSSSRRRAS